jgi:hypothetical protein
MNQTIKNCIDSIFMYQNKYSKITNLKLLYTKAVSKHHSNDTIIDAGIAIVLNYLNQQHILPLLFE